MIKYSMKFHGTDIAHCTQKIFKPILQYVLWKESQNNKGRKTGKMQKNKHSYQLLGSSNVKLQGEGWAKEQCACLKVGLLKDPSSQVGLQVAWPLGLGQATLGGCLHCAMTDGHCRAGAGHHLTRARPDSSPTTSPQDVSKQISSLTEHYLNCSFPVP